METKNHESEIYAPPTCWEIKLRPARVIAVSNPNATIEGFGWDEDE